MKILRLPIKGKWLAMIDAGIKGDEYREIKPYYISRFFENKLGRESIVTGALCDLFESCLQCTNDIEKEADDFGQRLKDYDAVELIAGYSRTARRSLYELKDGWLTVGRGRTDWGAPADKNVFRIHLGNRIQ